MYGDGRQLNEDLKARSDGLVFRMLADHGVDIARIDSREDGTFGMQYADGTRIEFGQAEGDDMTRVGWDYCAYGTDGEPDEQDWAPDDETLAEVLKSQGRDSSQG
jgi:hypothetical protein